MLEVKNLYYKHILKDISFAVKKGEILVVLGPNGAGKTTLFRCLARLIKPDKGEILLLGKPLEDYCTKKLYRLIALCPQHFRPEFSYRVRTFVLMGRTPYLSPLAQPRKKDFEAAQKALKILGLTDLAERPFSELSGGQQRLVSVARALTQEAQLIFLDEPTAFLDLRHQFLVMEKICQLARKNNLSLVLNLHDPNLALLFADRILTIKNGQLMGELPKNPDQAKIALKELYEIPFVSFSYQERIFVFPVGNFTD
ncbi:ABC transporter related protein [Thermodesulfatator indicus DSM 15286]|uniref:ABC transporter related protein n=1 Tax=Thermodesulfatator indicus (strain DSM 15286 / JCM 11887 / CIR29812) TaxID=667014 RepID=F8AB20_THEID|nr:ABC transporter ATP-binding protein [Thermodesulfatator indicus]AEH44386.1 ABC transporter related protein [Thermodesulfatator indicus DSM 15286]